MRLPEPAEDVGKRDLGRVEHDLNRLCMTGPSRAALVVCPQWASYERTAMEEDNEERPVLSWSSAADTCRVWRESGCIADCSGVDAPTGQAPDAFF